MTDNEIMQGLERMSEEDPEGFSSDVLAFIERQYAEIDKLNCVIVSAEQQLKLAAAAVDRQKNEIKTFNDFMETLHIRIIKLYDVEVIPFAGIKEHAKAFGLGDIKRNA